MKLTIMSAVLAASTLAVLAAPAEARCWWNGERRVCNYNVEHGWRWRQRYERYGERYDRRYDRNRVYDRDRVGHQGEVRPPAVVRPQGEMRPPVRTQDEFRPNERR